MSNTLLTLFDDGLVRTLGKDETLFHTDDPVHSMFLVTEGQVDLVRYTQSGARVMMQQAGPGTILAEGSAYSELYHCDATAFGQVSLRALPVTTFRARIDLDVSLANTWAALLARSLQNARMNAAIRTLRTVAERLEAWQAGGRPLPPKGEWQALAQTLGVTPEALYRELAKHRLG